MYNEEQYKIVLLRTNDMIEAVHLKEALTIAGIYANVYSHELEGDVSSVDESIGSFTDTEVREWLVTVFVDERDVEQP